MLRKILLLLILISISTNAQDTIRGKMTPSKNYTWGILYQLNGVSQKYVANTTISEGGFNMVIPKGTESGMYRLLYDNDNNKFIDIIYNNENIDLEFHPDYPAELVEYNKSDENIMFQDYIENISAIQNQLDSVQVNYFQTESTKKEKQLNNYYKKQLKTLKEAQDSYEKKSTGKIAHAFIKANKRFYHEKLIKDSQTYLKVVKSHYFDAVDFNSEILIKSSFLIDRIMDYIMYLNTSEDKGILTKMRKEAVAFSLSKIKKDELKKDIIESLLYMFAQQENKEIIDYIFSQHFNKLPVSLQDLEYKVVINDMLKTTIGQPAPNIVWEDKGKTYDLSKFKDSDYYLVVFWSTTCPHCLKEMPQLHNFLKEKLEIKTIAVGLETEESKVNWFDIRHDYEQFMHVLGLKKWKSKYSKDYGITSTPNFFILNKKKIIIAKPYGVKELKEFFSGLNKKK